LNKDREKQPSRTRRSRKLDDPFERAELRDGENEGENTQGPTSHGKSRFTPNTLMGRGRG